MGSEGSGTEVQGDWMRGNPNPPRSFHININTETEPSTLLHTSSPPTVPTTLTQN